MVIDAADAVELLTYQGRQTVMQCPKQNAGQITMATACQQSSGTERRTLLNVCLVVRDPWN